MPSPKKSKVSSRSTAASADGFLGGRLTIVQPRGGHRAGSDAVFLAAAVPARSGARVLDAGAGVAVAGQCLAARVPDVEVTAVEIDAELCALAEQNAARNGFGDRVRVINADVTAPAKALGVAGLEREAYDEVISNPPFHSEGAVRAASDRARATAHVMAAQGLTAWVRFFVTFAASKGRLTLIHRAECLGELLGLLDGRFGCIAVFPLFPKEGEPATRIIVQGRKGSRAAPRLLPGLVLHEHDGRYTAKAEAVLRGGEALDLGE
jgi:tRNA1(Val) A37 N6-methylase TrmN6